MRAAAYLLVLGLWLALPRNGMSQTAEIQKNLETMLALKRAGALFTAQDGAITQVSLSGLKNVDRLLDQVKALSKLNDRARSYDTIPGLKLGKMARNCSFPS